MEPAEGGPGGGDGIVSGSAAVLGGRCLRAVNALQAIGVVSVEGQRDDSFISSERTCSSSRYWPEGNIYKLAQFE